MSQPPGIGRRQFVFHAMGLGLGLSSVGCLLNAGKAKETGTELGPVEKELHIYNWPDYIAEETVADFEKEFGVEVSYQTYESNEELLARLESGACSHDIAVPSGYMVPLLVARNLISPLSPNYLTNRGNISAAFRAPATDPSDTYTIPWQWGTTGIAYRTDKLKVPVDSWTVFQDERFRGRMTMMDDGREVIGAMLRCRGHSLNSTDRAELSGALTDAIKAGENLAAWISGPLEDRLISGDVWIYQAWSGDTVQAQARQPHLAYVIPREGCPVWIDSMVIPKRARHRRAAHEWMNYILRPEVGAALSEATGYGTPNAAAARIMEDPAPYARTDWLPPLEYQGDLGEDAGIWRRIWSQLRDPSTSVPRTPPGARPDCGSPAVLRCPSCP